MPKHDVTVKLTGEDGNVFSIIGRVEAAMKRAGVPSEEIKEYRDLCLDANDYNHVLSLTNKTVNVI